MSSYRRGCDSRRELLALLSTFARLDGRGRKIHLTMLVINLVIAGSLVILVGCSRPKSRFESLTVSPDGTNILGVYFHSGSSFIYNIPVDTGKATRFTNATKGFEGAPSFSVDGKRIAYSYSPGPGVHSRIILANADGSNPHPLATLDADDFRPLFSTADKTLIFGRYRYYGHYSPIAQPTHHEWDFYVSDLDGANVRQLTNEKFYMVSRASISLDGKQMLFVSSESEGDTMVIYSLEQPPKPKQAFRPHVKDEPKGGGIFDDPSFLPDGKSILFLGACNGARGFDYDVYKMDLVTQEVNKITTANDYSYSLRVSLDGRRAVFVRDISKSGKRSEIILLDLATHKLTPLKVTGLD